MSLVEDILDVLRIVLEYFGMPPDMLVPVWDSQLCGQYRSIVRMIGTNLPLTPTPRVHFQIPLLTDRPHGHVDITMDTPAIPSFADVLWVFEDEGESFAKTRNHLPPKKQSTVNRDVVRYPGPAQNNAQRGGRFVRQRTEPDALKKITALENELLKLQAQIAMIVTAAPASGLTESQNTVGMLLMSPPPPPALTSTPRCAPPPPPPPPPCPGSSAKTSSLLELIRQRRKNDKDLKPQDSDVKGIPSMLDVLKDLNQVKLRSVARSPGGTPVGRKRSKGGAALLNDPAALIAEALKRKFAQHRHNNSSDKENSLELSPFGSPVTPKVPLHIRRSQGRLHV
ncbi:mitochondrial fission regulator 2 [Sander lucioperca]|uniref:Mitochondrial fission regulator n=1 Tax=Sander lucioperca TaxID=283035 RepID=A0A8D0D1E8_SANLU|nr:mitochondrial fission regulator 2 [Sander lucioperca]XP_031177776.1 mitochondrial fission regulator 2 [Sander lucioperca]XP_031177777.1 mitochondrial fission regulator 2 [Sander lucioperca]